MSVRRAIVRRTGVTPFAVLCAVVGAGALGLVACADIWGFDDLTGASNGRGNPDARIAIDEGAGGAGMFGTGGDLGGLAGMGAGGSPASGGIGGTSGAGGTAGSAGDGGARGGGGGSTGGSGAAGSGGATGGSGAGVGGRTGDGGSSAGGRPGTGGVTGAGGAAATGGVPGSGGQTGTGGAGTGGRTGTGGAGGCVSVTTQLLVNPGFDSGTTGWTISVAGGFPLIYAANGGGGNLPDVAAQSPPNLAWFGGYNNADDIAAQSVTIPATATAINLSFFYAVVSRATGNNESDVMDVTVTAGTQTTTVAHFNNLTSADNFTTFTAALPATLAGQTVRLQFRDQTDGNAITSFYIDTVALRVVTCP